MPIQFCCTQCGQPIEVDDEHAGKTAACPYCRLTLSVPLQSTYNPESAVMARPADGPAVPDTTMPSPYAAGHRPPTPPHRQRVARTFGSYALLCTALGALLFCVGVARGFQLLAAAGVFQPTSQPSPQDLMQIQMKIAPDPWVIGPQIGGAFFALAGLTLGIISLTQSRQGNWQGILATVLCGLFFLCICSGTVLSAVMGFGSAG
ncbi:MAG: hypothetical protein KA383_14300 [Phycisphaerae bacterium]|nr:hypothetical protein [Phycisphaerae bacterium]